MVAVVVLVLVLLAAPLRPALAQSLFLLRDVEIETTLRELSDPIFRAAGLDPSSIRIYIVNDNSLNAFVAGGQNLFLNSGLLITTETPDQLEGVIAHETGHIAGGHLSRAQVAMQNAGSQALLGTLLGLAAAAMGAPQVGIAAMAGYIGSGATKNSSGTGLSADGLNVGVIGLQATAYGLTVGGNYAFGRANGGLALLEQGVDDRDLSQWVGGLAYTIGNLTVGSNFAIGTSAGNVNLPAARKDKIWTVGANYNLAPGLALVAEYASGSRQEPGSNLNGPGNDKTQTDVFLLGTRIAF